MTLLDLADAARTSGLKVVEVNGWRTRGRNGSFAPRGVLTHHTGTPPSTKDSAVVDLLVRGRADLPGPLCQLGLSRDGTVYVIAAGRGNHAGRANAVAGVPAGDGNALWLGIEAFNSGTEGWSAVQLDAYHRLCAALCDFYDWPRTRVAAHAETSVTGKWDPGFGGRVIDMRDFRTAVAAAGSTTPNPESEEDDDMAKTSAFYYQRATDKSHVYLLINAGSGFVHEYESGGPTPVDGGYNSGIARGFDTGNYEAITESHAAALKRDALAMRSQSVELSGAVKVDAKGGK